MSCCAPELATSLAIPAAHRSPHDRRGVAQILDGLEQRHDDQIRRYDADVARIERAVHHAAFLLQQQHFQKIADGLRMADDVMADRLVAVGLAHRGGLGENRQFVLDGERIFGVQQPRRPRIRQQPQQKLLLLQFRERRVIIGDARACARISVIVSSWRSEFGADRRWRDGSRTLPRRESTAPALSGDHLAVVQPQRLVDRDEIGEKGPAVGVGRGRATACRIACPPVKCSSVPARRE